MYIRNYEKTDLTDLYSICLRTGHIGKDASMLYHQPEILGDMYVVPYTIFDERFCLLLVSDETSAVCGYCIGTIDTTRFIQFFEHVWISHIKEKYNTTVLYVPHNTIPVEYSEYDMKVLDLIVHFSYSASDVIQDYPAHLHIDLLPHAQGKGWGRVLITTLLELFHISNATGVHVEVDSKNTNAIEFYKIMGFDFLDCSINNAVMPSSVIMGRKFT